MGRYSQIDKEIFEASMVDYTFHSCVNLFVSGDLEYKGMLEMAVIELVKKKAEMQRELLSYASKYGASK